MRKEIKSKSKRKWIVGGGLFFGGIALLTTGFATWIVGTQITANDQQTTVTVDTVDNRSLILETTLDNADIHIGEAATTDSTLPVRVEGEKATDFEIQLDFTITKSVTVKRPTLIQIKLNEDYNDKGAGNKVLKTADDLGTTYGLDHTKTGHTKGTKYTYVELDEVAIALDDSAWKPVEGQPGLEVYTGTDVKVKLFKWGSFFNYSAPTAYYQTKLADDADDIEKTIFGTIAWEELQAMREHFTAPEGKNTIIPIELSLFTPDGE